MTIIKLFGVSVIGCVIAVMLRAYKPELCIPFVLTVGTVLLVSALEMLTGVFGDINAAFEGFGIDSSYMRIAIKVIVIAYLIQFASSMCRDAGESALAGKVELAGRVLVFSAAAPVILGILDLLTAFARPL